MLPSCLWSLRIFPSIPGSRLRIFIAMQVQHSCTSSINGLVFTYSRSHAFHYGSQNKRPDYVKNRTPNVCTRLVVWEVTTTHSGDHYCIIFSFSSTRLLITSSCPFLQLPAHPLLSRDTADDVEGCQTATSSGDASSHHTLIGAPRPPLGSEGTIARSDRALKMGSKLCSVCVHKPAPTHLWRGPNIFSFSFNCALWLPASTVLPPMASVLIEWVFLYSSCQLGRYEGKR